MVLTVLAVGAVAAQAQHVYYEDRALTYDRNEQPYTVRGSLMVPVRKTAEMIGADFSRDSSGRRITMNWRNNRVNFYQGDRNFDLNGRRVTLTGTSETRYDTLFVPYEIFRELTDGRFSMNRGQGWGRGGDIGRRRPGDPDDPRNRDNGRWDQDQGRWDRTDPRYDPRYDRTDPRYDPRYDRTDPRYDQYYGRDQIMFDNRPLTFDRNEQPYTRNGVLMVPFRAMGEKIGARTDRTADGLRTWIYFGGDRVEYDKGKTWYRINSTRRELRTTSEERGELLFVPITLFEEVARGRIRFNGSTYQRW